MRNRSIARHVAILVTVVLCMGAALPVAAAENVRGWGIAMAKDLGAKTLKIDDKTYKVVAGTTFKDLEGNVISFADLAIFDVNKGLFNVKDATVVEYVARQNEGLWYLVSVKRVPELPR
jgi:hypothetical protein